MSLSSRIDRPSPSIPISISEVDSNMDSSDSAECFSSPNLSRGHKPAGLLPLKDFKESLENEKNIRKYLTKFESLQVPNSLRNGKIMEVLEKNYKLQVQTLLEEVNQLKLDKKILEKKMERVQRGTSSPQRSKNDFGLDSTIDDSMMKRTLEAKNSTIKELEFQLAQSNKENSNLKMRLDVMSKQMQDFVERIADSENVKEILEEKDDEITNLRAALEADEVRQDKFLKELSYLRNENIALKLKSHCTNCGQPPTGTTSFTNPQLSQFPCNSKEQSFYLSEKCEHQRNGSEGKFIGKILNLSEINDDQRLGGGGGSPSHTSARFRPFLSSRTRDSGCETERTKSDFGQLQNLSMKVLSEYEEGLKKEKSIDTRRDSKTLERIIEVNKIKSYMIEAQNKKLLSMLNGTGESGSKSYRGPITKY